MRFEIRWKTGLAPALVAVARDRLTLGLARVTHRIGRVVLWREMRTEAGHATLHWVVRAEVDGSHLVVAAPDPGDDVDAAAHAGLRFARAIERGLALREGR
jgi:hypothetical protein